MHLCSFGYHLGVVNGPLAAIAADLGFAGDAALQGLVGLLLIFFSFLPSFAFPISSLSAFLSLKRFCNPLNCSIKP